MEILIQRLILMEVLLEPWEQKGSADNLKKLAQEVDAKSTVIANILNAKAGKQKVSILAPAGK